MPRLPTLKPKQVVNVMERAGFRLARQKGSHKIYVRDKIGITIPIHNKDLKRGTLSAIIKQSGLTVEEFLELL